MSGVTGLAGFSALGAGGKASWTAGAVAAEPGFTRARARLISELLETAGVTASCRARWARRAAATNVLVLLWLTGVSTWGAVFTGGAAKGSAPPVAKLDCGRGGRSTLLGSKAGRLPAGASPGADTDLRAMAVWASRAARP